MSESFISHSPSETQFLAHKILKLLRLPKLNVVCLYGELGSGKTTFVQGLAKALGIKKRILSPTFILIREYHIPKFALCTLHFALFYHVDCYRVESEGDFKSISLQELWSSPKNLVVIEWAEKIKNILPKKRIDIKFEYLAEPKRRITLASLS